MSPSLSRTMAAEGGWRWWRGGRNVRTALDKAKACLDGFAVAADAGPALNRRRLRAPPANSGGVHGLAATAYDDDEHRLHTMPEKVVETPYPLIDSDPHAGRVISYFRTSDYATWAGATAAFPAALYFWGVYPRCSCRQPRR